MHTSIDAPIARTMASRPRRRVAPALWYTCALMGLPKVKLSKGRKGRRRSHLALVPIQLQPCPQCRRPRQPHRVCPNCGSYGGREVIKTD